MLTRQHRLTIRIKGTGLLSRHPMHSVSHRHSLLRELVALNGTRRLSTRCVAHLFRLVVRSSMLARRTLLRRRLGGVGPRSTHVTFLNPGNSCSRLTTHRCTTHRFRRFVRDNYTGFTSVFGRIRANRTSCTIMPVRGADSNTVGSICSLLRRADLSVINRVALAVSRYLLISNAASLSAVGAICDRPRPFRRYDGFLGHCPR